MCKIGTPNFKFAGKSLPDSLYEQVLRTRGLLHIDDLNCEPVSSHPLHRRLVDRGVKSFSLFSLFFGSRHVGFFELYSHEPRALSAPSGEEIKDLLPIFSLVMQRSIDEHKNSIELLLEEKCTPLHPSIEWRFREIAQEALFSPCRSQSIEDFPQVILRDIYPLFGQSDIASVTAHEARARPSGDGAKHHAGIALRLQ